jgi:UDP-2,3-diacylglucosamine hydrolase
MKAIFFSDAHLVDKEPEKSGIITEALREISKDADMVFILGDLFEFYHGHGRHVYPFYAEIVDLLREIAAKSSVYYIEGNHEFGMGDFFESYTGVRCLESLTVRIDGKKVFLSHGDEIGAPLLRRVLKSRFVYRLMDLLGPGPTWKIAMLCRPLLSKSHKPYNEKILDRFRRYGKKKLREGYDAVITAHSHMADLEEHDLNGLRKTYMNTGDLIESLTYGVYDTDKGFSISTYVKR